MCTGIAISNSVSKQLGRGILQVFFQIVVPRVPADRIVDPLRVSRKLYAPYIYK